jgi:hypothetical protein
MKGTPSKTVWFNILAIIVMGATALGFGDFKPSQEVIEFGAILVSVINLWLRLRPLPPEAESQGVR